MTQLPKVWLLASPHTGDNTQLKALAENLGWPFEVKTMSYRSGQTLARLSFGATLSGLTQLARAQVLAPYPDLVISAGRPTEAVALWIKKYGNPNVKLVTVGTPWAKLSAFDLIITTPQYGLPVADNVLHNQLPMHKIDADKLSTAAKLWGPKLVHLPKPWTAVLVGGSSGPYGFDASAARRLALEATALGGSLLVTTSARTPLDVSMALQQNIQSPIYFHSWSKTVVENPFLGFLSLADQFIVSADSISMLSEASATGKPVLLFDTESGRHAMRDGGKKVAWIGKNISTTAFRIAMRLGPPNWSRDLRVVHNQLIAAGRANWLGETIPPTNQNFEAQDLMRATTRVRALFDL
jgi:uncharacterized protein